MAARRAETVTVTVVRTGGVAGMPREWTLTASGEGADLLRELVDSDAGAAVAVDPGSRDRFSWRIVVTGVGRRRTLTVPEGHLSGSLEELVRHVQEHGHAVTHTGRSESSSAG